MFKIYCIEDINDLRYIGSTKQSLQNRFYGHIHKKNCSSRQLILENSIIYELETCNKEEVFERERYWINKIDCVNIKKNNYYENKEEYDKEYHKQYYKKNKNKIREQQKQYYNSRLI